MENKILNEDCLDAMNIIPNESIDMILCDLPYGTTACKWDTIIPFDKLWEQYERIIKPNGAIVLTSAQPFTSALVMSNPKLFKYEWIWNKKRVTAPMLAKKQPLRQHESILVFYKKQCCYNYQPTIKNTSKSFSKKEMFDGKGEVYGGMKRSGTRNENEIGYPKSILNDIPVITNMSSEKFLHPTQKPIALFEYLIKTYTNENELVLDNCAGSGTTAIACLNTNRKFIVIEKEKKYYEMILKRVGEKIKEKDLQQQSLF